MTLSINMNPGASANGGVGIGLMTIAGNPWAVTDALALDLVNRGLATAANWPPASPLGVNPSAPNAANAATLPAVLMRSGVPMILQGGGTVGANGALSGIPTLPRVYAQCYMYFPNGRAYSGSVAGWYYVVMSSVTAGTIYNNRAATEGPPIVPTTLVPISDAGPGAYTQLTGTTITAMSLTIKGGSLGPHGGLRVTEIISIANTASNKVTEVYLGGQNFGSFSISTTGYFAGRYVTDIGFTGSASQVGTYYSGYGGFGADLSRATVNTLVDQALTLTLNIANQTDFNAIEMADVLAFYGA